MSFKIPTHEYIAFIGMDTANVADDPHYFLAYYKYTNMVAISKADIGDLDEDHNLYFTHKEVRNLKTQVKLTNGFVNFKPLTPYRICQIPSFRKLDGY